METNNVILKEIFANCYRVIDSNDFICPMEAEEVEIGEVIDFVINFDTFER